MLLAGNSFLLPFYLEVGKKIPTQNVGLIIMIYSVIYMAVGPFAGRISDKIRPSTLCAFAMLSAALCSFVFAFTLHMPGIVPVVIFLIWIAFSFGFFISPNNNQVMRLAPAHKQGSASGVFNTINSLGLALGVCIFESLMSRTSPGDRTADIPIRRHGRIQQRLLFRRHRLHHRAVLFAVNRVE